jgi:nitroreductase
MADDMAASNATGTADDMAASAATGTATSAASDTAAGSANSLPGFSAVKLYDAIFCRRSVRKYQQDALSQTQLDEIQAALDASTQISGQEARFEIVDKSEFKLASSPYAIFAHCADNDAALCNIGYTLQTMDLYLQGIGLGSLWNGTARPATPRKDYRIMLNFGKTDVPRRNGAADFKRKPVLEISNEGNAVAEAARLAPSAVNFQPWHLEFSSGEVLVSRVPGGITMLLSSKFQPIDLGIVVKHIVLAFEHDGKAVRSIEPVGSGKSFAVKVLLA